VSSCDRDASNKEMTKEEKKKERKKKKKKNGEKVKRGTRGGNKAQPTGNSGQGGPTYGMEDPGKDKGGRTAGRSTVVGGWGCSELKDRSSVIATLKNGSERRKRRKDTKLKTEKGGGNAGNLARDLTKTNRLASKESYRKNCCRGGVEEQEREKRSG